MKYWLIKAFKGSRNEIEKWLDGLDPEPRQKIKTFIKRLEVIEKWDSKYFMPYTGYHGIYEIKIKFKKVQYRPLGCFSSVRKEFVLLIGAKEKDNKLIPKNAAKRAKERCELICKDRGYIDDLV